MNIWPFSEIRKLQESLAMANETNVQAVKNFNTLHSQAKQAESQANDYYRRVTSYRRVIATKEEQLIARRVEVAQLTADLNETKSALEITQKYVREQEVRLQEANERSFNASEAHVITMGKFDQALDRIVDMVKGDDGQAWKEAEKFLAQHRGTKFCVKCGSKMIELRGEDKKLCSNGACGHEVDWPLEEGQTYMYKRDVEPFIEDRSKVSEELEPARSTLERL